MKVAFISSETFPFSKTGGLADVAGSLPKELRKLDVDIKVFTPKYEKFLNPELELVKKTELDVEVLINGKLRKGEVFKSNLPNSNVEVFLVANPFYFGRGKIYTDDEDEGERFVFFQKAVAEIFRKMNWLPDLIHANDWQSALMPYYVREKDPDLNFTASVLTLHNVGYQGIFPKEFLDIAEVERRLFFPMGPAEFYGKFNFLKMGVYFADKLSTVSPTYAKEILNSEQGAGLEGILRERERDLVGILNGVDYNEWNPTFDKFIFKNYDKETLPLKVENKVSLCKKLGLKCKEEVPLFGLISRLVPQKGIDLLIDAMPELLKLNAHWVFLGSGFEGMEKALKEFEQAFPEKISVQIGYDNELAHQIEAAADVFLMPSRYEPCGLNQIYSLKYGTLPLVHSTGGLADTVIPYRKEFLHSLLNADGFSFAGFNKKEFLSAVLLALETFEKKDVWERLQFNAMSKDFSWSKSAREYKKLYEAALQSKRDVLM